MSSTASSNSDLGCVKYSPLQVSASWSCCILSYRFAVKQQCCSLQSRRKQRWRLLILILGKITKWNTFAIHRLLCLPSLNMHTPAALKQTFQRFRHCTLWQFCTSVALLMCCILSHCHFLEVFCCCSNDRCLVECSVYSQGMYLMSSAKKVWCYGYSVCQHVILTFVLGKTTVSDRHQSTLICFHSMQKGLGLGWRSIR